MGVSPDGTKLASATKGGLLYVHDSSTGQLLGGFKVRLLLLALEGKQQR